MSFNQIESSTQTERMYYMYLHSKRALSHLLKVTLSLTIFYIKKRKNDHDYIKYIIGLSMTPCVWYIVGYLFWCGCGPQLTGSQLLQKKQNKTKNNGKKQ